MDYICSVIARLVFSGINGTILIIPLVALLYIVYGQAKDVKRVVRKALNEK